MSILEDLNGLQDSDEQQWGTVDLSFSIETRSSDDELIHREYTFNYVPETEEWMFCEFEEKRTRETDRIADRDWRKSRKAKWDDPEKIDVTVPTKVTEQLQKMLDCENFVLRQP